ncbi:hypothetical protein AAHA92_26927 [Salvia divinorum]|uniref:Uncharacterized protein n=1 Tax=Salvia divinorum TaxID=28513 RepID=A0ABD1G255_SALDI
MSKLQRRMQLVSRRFLPARKPTRLMSVQTSDTFMFVARLTSMPRPCSTKCLTEIALLAVKKQSMWKLKKISEINNTISTPEFWRSTIRCVASTTTEIAEEDSNLGGDDAGFDVITFPLHAHDISKELITPFVMREKVGGVWIHEQAAEEDTISLPTFPRDKGADEKQRCLHSLCGNIRKISGTRISIDMILEENRQIEHPNSLPISDVLLHLPQATLTYNVMRMMMVPT